MTDKMWRFCGVCEEEFVQPRLLPCLHTICDSCITDLIALARDNGTACLCFFCKEPFEVDFLPINVLAISSTEASAIQDQTIICKTHTAPVSIFCAVCESLVCFDCIVVAGHIGHELLSFGDAVTRLRTLLLSYKTKLRARISSLDAGIVELKELATSITNRLVGIENSINTAFDALLNKPTQQNVSDLIKRRETLISTARKELMSDFKITQLQIEGLELARSSIQVAYDQTCHLIAAAQSPQLISNDENQGTLARMVTALDEPDLAAAIAELDSPDLLMQSKVPKLKQHQDLQRQQQDLQRLSQQLHNLSNHLLLQHQPADITTEIQTQAQTPTEEHTFSSTTLLNIFGTFARRLRVIESTELALQPMVRGELLFTFLSNTEVSVDQIGFVGRRLRDYSQIDQPSQIIGEDITSFNFHFPIALAVTGRGNVIVADHSNRGLQVATSGGEHLRTILLEDSGGLLDFALSPNGYLWTASHNGIKCFTTDGSFVRTITTDHCSSLALLPNGDIAYDLLIPQSVKCVDSNGVERWTSRGDNLGEVWGMTANRAAEIIVSDTTHGQLQVISAHDGAFIRTIGRNQLDTPAGLSCTDDGLVVVCEYWSHRVSLWSLSTGERLHVFGHHGALPGQFRRPVRVVCLTDARIAIADEGNDRIQLF